jgi:ATP-binding cassette subfamily B protein
LYAFFLSPAALLNFETVKYFGAEQHEEARYDAALQAYSHANTRSQQTLAVLNSGQQLIIVTGVVCVMVLAARLVTQHALVIGDFVLLFQFILTLYQPLGFLGMYYRMIKSRSDNNSLMHRHPRGSRAWAHWRCCFFR